MSDMQLCPSSNVLLKDTGLKFDRYLPISICFIETTTFWENDLSLVHYCGAEPRGISLCVIKLLFSPQGSILGAVLGTNVEGRALLTYH